MQWRAGVGPGSGGLRARARRAHAPACRQLQARGQMFRCQGRRVIVGSALPNPNPNNAKRAGRRAGRGGAGRIMARWLLPWPADGCGVARCPTPTLSMQSGRAASGARCG